MVKKEREMEGRWREGRRKERERQTNINTWTYNARDIRYIDPH